MADVSTAVRRLQIETTVTGASDAAAQLGRLNASFQSNATGATAAEKASGQYESRLAAMQRQVDALTRTQIAQNAALTANAAALSNSSSAMVAANDNAAKSFSIAGLEAAELASHVKLAAEAAYAFSPAFRGVVNGLAAPALRGASVALVAVAGAMVTGTNLAGSGLVRLGAAAASFGPSFAPVAAAVTSAGVAMQAFSPSLAGVATSILSRLAPALSFILGPLLLVYHAVSLATEAWRLGGEELDRYRKIAEDAAKVDLSTTYFQKLTKGAEEAKVPVEALTKALTNLQASSADKLGGSALQSRLDASVKAGNFSDNTGVQEFAQANTTQQRYEAIVSLIHQAMDAGQRLAALDIAGTAFGPEAAANLAKDSEYFDKINAAAAKVVESKLVSPEDIGRAVELQNRYDAAVKILETRWHPIQDLLTQAGVEFHANWVATVETIAQAFDWTAKMVAKLGEVPSWFQKKLNEGGQWIIDNTTTPESRKAAEATSNTVASAFGQTSAVSSDPAEMAKGTDAYSIAVNKLRAGLQDQQEQQRKVSEANTIAQKTLGDTSHAIDTNKKAATEQADAYDRALESVTKHIARQQADAQAVGLGAGALEEFRARSQLVTAAQAAGRPITAALTAEIEAQAKAAGAAGQALALMRVQNQIKEDRQTVGFSQEDLQIAQALKQVYPDITERMNSAEAAQMRLNNSLKAMADAQRDAFGDFLQNMRQGKSVMDSLTSALGGFTDKLAKIGSDKLFDALKTGDFSKAFGLSAANDNITTKQTLDDIELKGRNAASNSANSFQFNGNTAMAGAAAVGSAVGIYGQAKSQAASGGSVGSSVASGALSGALSGAAIGSIVPGIGTLIGGAIGGVAGAIMGWFGGNSGADEAAQKARDDWASVKVQASEFARVLATGGSGSLMSALTQARTQTISYADTARKAGDVDGADKIWDSFAKYVVRSTDAFRYSFGGVIDALNSGLGPSSPFSSAAQNVKDLGDQLKGFVADTELAFSADPFAMTGGTMSSADSSSIFKGVFDAIAGKLQQTPATPVAQTGQEQIDEARRASQNYLLSLLGQAPVLTDVATAIDHLSGTAVQLQSTLVELGMSSDQATASINAGIIAAMQQLAATFTNGLQREINSAIGEDYLNSTADLIAKQVSNLQDAASLGVDPALVTKWFSVSAQKIVDDAQLTGDAFNALVNQFPALQGAVHAFIDQAAIDAAAATAAQATQAAQQARLQQAQTQIQTAISDLTSAYQSQSGALNDLISTGKGFVDQFAKLRASLRLDDSLSPLSDKDKYLQAQATARSDAALAANGDTDAQSRLADDLNEYLAQSKSYNASTLAYYNDFTEVQSILDQAGDTAQHQVDVAQQQLSVLNQQVAGLIQINSSVMSVAQAIANMSAAQSNVNQQRDFGVRPEVNKWIQNGLEAAGLNFTGNYGPNGDFGQWVASQTASIQAQIAAIAQSVPQSLVDFYARQGYMRTGGVVGAFANGGMVGNGIFDQDSVLARYAGGGNIALAGGEYVMPANQTRANLPMLDAMRSGRSGGSNDNSAVVAELRAVRAELAALRQTTASAGEHVGNRVDASAGVQKQSAAAMRQAGNRPAAYGTRKAG